TDYIISMDDRIMINNTNHSDGVVSIDYNAFPDPIVSESITYNYSGGEDKNLVNHIQDFIVESNLVYDRGVRQGDYKVLRENSDLAVLIELGFITNPEELQTMQTADFQNDAAKAITNGLINYFAQ